MFTYFIIIILNNNNENAAFQIQNMFELNIYIFIYTHSYILFAWRILFYYYDFIFYCYYVHFEYFPLGFWILKPLLFAKLKMHLHLK